MSRGPCTFRKRDVEAALRAAAAAGLHVSGYEIGKDGKIIVHTSKAVEQQAIAGGNEWDNP